MKVIDYIKKNRSFILSIFLLFAVRWSIADQNRVPSGSMIPTLHVGDHIGVNKMAYDFKLPFTSLKLAHMGNPERGDIIVFIWPGDNSTTYVKRLIGIPGDRIKVKNGFITINGKALESASLNQNATVTYTENLDKHQYQVQRLPMFAREETFEVTVPEDSYFFMGDNRDDSNDGRYWGFVKRDALKGKVQLVLWNINFDDILPTMDFSRIFKSLI